MIAHQHPAVLAGLVTLEAAFCGLSADDVARLRASAPATLLVVKFRSSSADWSATMSACAFPRGSDARNALSYVRSVYLAAQEGTA